MLTKDEAELYDRQIRLWGVNAQSRLRQSKVLMLGFNGVASEVAKILVLAGIDTLTIVDDQPLQEDDAMSNLFCRPEKDLDKASNGQPTESDGETKFRTRHVQEKLRKLNPLVKVEIDNTSILGKKPEEFKGYDLVTLHTILTTDRTNDINDICRANNVKFYLVIDYGFFGFMFNDLGEEFKFTHERYDNKKRELQDPTNSKYTNKQSGGIKDPINFDDEKTDTTGCDDSTNDDEDDDDERHEGRPRKRMRLDESVAEQRPNHDRDEMKHTAGSASYVTFRHMISFKGAQFDKKTSPILFISIAMIEFYSKYKHLPLRGTSDSAEQHQQDLSRLNEIVASMKDTLQLDEVIFKKLDPEWSKHITGSLSPVCAVVGGVAGQDMIRTLSGKDIPICNTFSFDGIEMSGAIERLGIEDKKFTASKPIIRDVIECDDSD